MKILIVGAHGLLGTELLKTFADHNPTGWGRDDLDITNEQQVRERIGALAPELIINAAAYTDVEGAEDDKETAALVNGYAVRLLAETAEALGVPIVHYSTDYVFDGTNEDGYAEDDKPAEEPLNTYGASKLLGERELVQATSRFFLIRTSWLFGSNGKNFIDTMIRLAQERPELKVVNDQHGRPTATPDLAKATRQLIEGDYAYGIYHFSNEGEPTTWYEYAQFVIAEYGKKHAWKQEQFPAVIATTSAEFGGKATRPTWSVLRNTKFPPLRPWREAVLEYINQKP